MSSEVKLATEQVAEKIMSHSKKRHYLWRKFNGKFECSCGHLFSDAQVIEKHWKNMMYGFRSPPKEIEVKLRLPLEVYNRFYERALESKIEPMRLLALLVANPNGLIKCTCTHLAITHFALGCCFDGCVCENDYWDALLSMQLVKRKRG